MLINNIVWYNNSIQIVENKSKDNDKQQKCVNMGILIKSFGACASPRSKINIISARFSITTSNKASCFNMKKSLHMIIQKHLMCTNHNNLSLDFGVNI